MKTHALASTTLTCSPSVSGHFTHFWVSLCTSCRQFLIIVFNYCRCNRLLNFDLYANSLQSFTLRKRVFGGVVFAVVQVLGALVQNNQNFPSVCGIFYTTNMTETQNSS